MEFLQSIITPIQSFAQANFGLNWLDLVIVIIFIFYGLEGFSVGFVNASLDLCSFVLSFIFGLRFYGVIAQLLITHFAVPQGFANAGGFFLVAIVSELLVSILFHKLLNHVSKKIPEQSLRNPNLTLAYLQTANNVLGFIPGLLSGAILLAFLLTLIISLPFSPFLKHAVSGSRFGNPLVAQAQGFEKNLNAVFGGAVQDTLNFLTVKPESNEFVKLNFKTTEVTVDEGAEEKMLMMVNQERTSRGLKALTMDERLRTLARDYSKNMFEKGYFSHYTPEGTSPFDRMDNAGITYTAAGENLALAPNVDLAMQGLMKSPGHRANILSPNFGKIGIGVMDGGIYGEMFSQEFTN